MTNKLPLKTAPVFENAPGDLGIQWRNLCDAENELAEKLLCEPLGQGVVLDTDVWFLKEEDGQLVLCHGNYIEGEVSEESSRFDFSLEWVDVEGDQLEEYASRVRQAMESFEVIAIEV